MPNTIEDNLNRLKATVPAISNAIIAKGGTVTAGDGLEEFAADIMSIKNDLTSIDITANGTFYSSGETVVTSSTFPIVINDSDGTPVRHANINGNTVQSGTPTPSSPVEANGVGTLDGGQYKIPISSTNTITPVYLGEVATTRKIGKFVLTGNEYFLKNSSEDTNYLYYVNNVNVFPGTISKTPALCNELPVRSGPPIREIGINTDNDYGVVYFNFGADVMNAQPSGNTTEGLKEYLATQYANGTPVTVWCVLATEKTGIVNEPLMKIGDYADSLSVDVELPLSPNTENSIDVNTTLKPSSASFTYNRLYEDIGYNEIHVDVPNTYTAEDEGKVVSEGNLIVQTAMPDEITKNGTIDTTFYSSVTVNVPSGGGSASPNAVNFYDYDGTIVQSYSAADFANLTAMPANPTHEGLTSQGWNWSLANAKTYVASYGKLNIGQMYITSDGKTRLYISLPEGRTSPILQLYLNTNSELDIDWGDGSTHSTFTSTSADYKSERHEYSTSGDYVIAITVVDGGFVLQSSSTSVSSILWDGNDMRNSPDSVYNNAIKNIEIGDDSVTSIGDYAFQSCYSLSSITIPDTVTSIGQYAFNGCYSLSSITIPDTVTSIGDYAFHGCYSLSSITIPDTVTSISSNAFQSCYSLSSITIPDTVTSISSNAFQSCYSLSSITIPDSVTSIGQYAFSSCYSLSSITIPDTVTSISSNAFNGCYSLSSITIPSSVTDIGGSAFRNCSYMSYIKFKSTTPPIVENSNTWGGVSTLTKILVPTGTLNTYKTATNYPNPSTYTYEEY